MGRLIEKMYGSYSDADLNDWERLPMNASVLTSSAFGAWLLRRDERRDKAIPKADYENRLKADMVAMLTELSMKIGEIEDGYVEFDEENKRSLTMIPLERVERLIDREINSLEEA